jgi:glycerophosphoryl diester phosphodiesterase
LVLEQLLPAHSSTITAWYHQPMKNELHPYLEHPGVLAFAHRGGAEDYPENTMLAFNAAVGMGYRYIETDVHITADGHLLAFHDDRLDRVCDGEGLIQALPWSAVKSARVAGSEPIVELPELLETFSETRFNLDIKHWAALEPCLDLLDRMRCWDRVCIGSFSDRRLGRVRGAIIQSHLNVCTSMGPLGVLAMKAREFRLPTGSRAQCAQVPVKHAGIPVVTRGFVDTCHRQGIQVHVWTIDDPAEMRRLVELGVDGLMTDKPSLLKQVLVEMGRW